MATNGPRSLACSYVVLVQKAAASREALQELAAYLSTLRVAGCEVAILDPSPAPGFQDNARILRWVGRHVSLQAAQAGTQSLDTVRIASTLALSEKVIIAADDVRYEPDAIGQVCDLLERHEVVEPQDYLDPLPWWGAIEAGRMLLYRGVEPQPDHRATFGFRRSALRLLGGPAPVLPAGAEGNRLAAIGAEVYPASDVFVRRGAGTLAQWLESGVRGADRDLSRPMKTLPFLALIPLAILLVVLGGSEAALAFLGIVSFTSIGLAVKGRAGASRFFPFRACFFAPLWIFERALTVYWALSLRLAGAREPAARAPAQARSSGSRAASGQ